MKKYNHYPLEKVCCVCGSNFIVCNGAEFRNTTCSKICGDKKATATRARQGHWTKTKPYPTGEKHHFFGRHHSLESKAKISLSKKGNSPSWCKGIPCTLEAKEKMSLAKNGKHLSVKTELRKGLLLGTKGRNALNFLALIIRAGRAA